MNFQLHPGGHSEKRIEARKQALSEVGAEHIVNWAIYRSADGPIPGLNIGRAPRKSVPKQFMDEIGERAVQEFRSEFDSIEVAYDPAASEEASLHNVIEADRNGRCLIREIDAKNLTLVFSHPTAESQSTRGSWVSRRARISWKRFCWSAAISSGDFSFTSGAG
jgi:hypothetical protein